MYAKLNQYVFLQNFLIVTKDENNIDLVDLTTPSKYLKLSVEKISKLCGSIYKDVYLAPGTLMRF